MAGVEYLFQHTPQVVEIIDFDENTILHTAIFCGKWADKWPGEIVLIVNETNSVGDRPLHLATSKNRVKEVQWLIENEANNKMKYSNGLTVLDISKQCQFD